MPDEPKSDKMTVERRQEMYQRASVDVLDTPWFDKLFTVIQKTSNVQ